MSRRFAALCALFAFASLPVPAAEPRQLSDIYISAGDQRWIDQRRYQANGAVLFDAGDYLLQADKVSYDQSTGLVTAEGNVVFKSGGTTMHAARFEYDSVAQTGNAEGVALHSAPYFITGERVEKVGPEKWVVHRGEMTTCTQALPTWTMKVTRATVTLHDYMRLANVRVHAGPVPALWVPWLVYPIKDERTTGLLVPRIGYGIRNGYQLSNTFYWAPVDWFDSATTLDLLSVQGAGWGQELRYKPNKLGRAQLNAYYIKESEPLTRQEVNSGVEMKRWSLDYYHYQPFGPGFLAYADVHAVSDPLFYPHYSREYTPSTRSFDNSEVRLSLERPAWGFKVSGVRQRQYFLDAQLTRHAEPSVNVHLNETRLFGALTLSGEGGWDRIRRDTLSRTNVDYRDAYTRAYLAPRVTWVPFASPLLKGRLDLSGTFQRYSRTTDPLQPDRLTGPALSRDYFRGRAQLTGPTLFRVFDAPSGSRWRHSSGASVEYSHTTDAEGTGIAPIFDARDLVAAGERMIALDLNSRLTRKENAEAMPEERIGANLSFRYSTGSPFPAPAGETPSRWGPASFNLRWRAGKRVGLDLRYHYDLAHRRAESYALSAHIEEGAHGGYLDFHYLKVNSVNLSQFQLAQGLTTQALSQSYAADQLQVFARRDFFDDRIGLAFATNYDFGRGRDTSRMIQVRLRGQCATLITDARITRDATGTTYPTYTFSVDFLGLGNLINTTAQWPAY